MHIKSLAVRTEGRSHSLAHQEQHIYAQHFSFTLLEFFFLAALIFFLNISWPMMKTERYSKETEFRAETQLMTATIYSAVVYTGRRLGISGRQPITDHIVSILLKHFLFNSQFCIERAK